MPGGADWWRTCQDCNGHFRERERTHHYRFLCPLNSPVAGMISMPELANALGITSDKLKTLKNKYKLQTKYHCGITFLSKAEYERFLREDGRLVAGSIQHEARKVG